MAATTTKNELVGQKKRRDWLLNLIRIEGISSRAFASKVSVHYGSISSMTTGGRDITDLTIYRICRKLRVLPPAGMDKPVYVGHPRMDEETRKMKKRIAALSREVAHLNKRLRTQGR